MLLFCVIVTLLTVNNAVGTDYEFFQSDEATFTCEHNKALSELSEVEWKIGTQTCALMYIEAGNIVKRSYNCAFEPRANFTSTSLTLSKMQSDDDGEFSCTATLSDEVTRIEVTRFNVAVKVRPYNHLLLVNDESHDCTDVITVDSTPNNLMLKCSVESKPQATFTWSTNPALSGSLLNTTECGQNSTSLVYTCSNILTLPSDKVPQSGNIEVTCRVEAVGETKDICVKLAEAIAKCNTTSCLNGGSCNSATGCQCAENWKGKNCSEVCDYITTPPESYDITLGDSHTFVCNSSESVTWRKDGDPPRVENTLSLPKVHQKQAGFYYCSSSSSECKQAVRFTLRVLHHWDDGLDVKEVKVEIGSSKIIKCNVTGKPVPNVQWSRLTDGNYDSLGNASEGYSVLEFDSFEETDAGEYVCSASYLDVLTNWTISIKVDDGSGSSSGLPTWAVVVIVLLAAVLLGIIVLFILLKLLLVKAAATAAGPFGSTTNLIVVGLLVVILLPGVGFILVISYYLIKVTGPSHGVENGKQVERKQSTANASKVHPETETNEPQVISSNGTKGGTITPPTGAPPLAAVSGAQLAHSATVTQTHGGAPMKLEPLASTENTPADGQEKKKKKKKKKHKKNKQEKDVENQGEDMTAETRLVSHDAEET